jgi:hypothetical protein
MAVLLVTSVVCIINCIIFFVLFNIFGRVGGAKAFQWLCFFVWIGSIIAFWNGVIVSELKEVSSLPDSAMFNILICAMGVIIPTVVLLLLFGVPALVTGIFLELVSDKKIEIKSELETELLKEELAKPKKRNLKKTYSELKKEVSRRELEISLNNYHHKCQELLRCRS